MSFVTTEMDLTEFSYQKKKEKLLKKFDLKLGQAIKQDKWPMVSYYYGRLTGIFDVFRRTNSNKELCPNWQILNIFSQNYDEKKAEIFLKLLRLELSVLELLLESLESEK